MAVVVGSVGNTVYTEWGFLVVFLSLSKEIPGEYLEYVRPLPRKSFRFIINPTICPYIILR
jgi:hypothetical protein